MASCLMLLCAYWHGCADLETGADYVEDLAPKRRAGASGMTSAKADVAETVGLLSKSRSGA